MSLWLVQLVRLYWHPRLGVVLLVGFAAGVVAAFYVVVTLAPELSARRMILPVAVIVFMSGGLQYVAVRRLGRSPWAFSFAYALPFLFWTLLFVGEVVPPAWLRPRGKRSRCPCSRDTCGRGVTCGERDECTIETRH